MSWASGMIYTYIYTVQCIYIYHYWTKYGPLYCAAITMLVFLLKVAFSVMICSCTVKSNSTDCMCVCVRTNIAWEDESGLCLVLQPALWSILLFNSRLIHHIHLRRLWCLRLGICLYNSTVRNKQSLSLWHATEFTVSISLHINLHGTYTWKS